MISENSIVTSLKLENGSEFFFDKIILATGGKSYPVTGSTGDGYDMAERLGHTVTPLRPSLVPIMTKESVCSLVYVS